MRAPFQILAIPYRRSGNQTLYCVFRRAKPVQWQFIAGGGEDDEKPLEAAKREIWEESGITADTVFALTSTSCIPTSIFPNLRPYNWPPDTYVIPEYAFAFPCEETVKLSAEHTDFAWLSYEEAVERLTWDSNKTALYELHCRLADGNVDIGTEERELCTR